MGSIFWTRPAVHRPFIFLLHNIDKTGILQPLPTLLPNREALPEPSPHLHNRFPPQREKALLIHRPIIAHGQHTMLNHFHISPGFRVFECRGEELVPVGHGPEQFPDVDEVELALGVCPVKVQVFDFEGAVWRYEEGLDGGEVGPDYVGRGVGVGHFAKGVSIALFCLMRKIWRVGFTLPRFQSRFRCQGYCVGCLEAQGGAFLLGS